jgi:hypothetical protein
VSSRLQAENGINLTQPNKCLIYAFILNYNLNRILNKAPGSSSRKL